jgi:3-oxoacyl-[acyl-carrier protein] reductase/meso-butanediol dehydrogenase/(S,S)-butanediol dehydrogenase/diacetyl reductase
MDADKPTDRSAHRGRWCPELKGKCAIVTGAGRFRSIGRQIALELARQGVNIVLTGTGRDPSRFPSEEREIGWNDITSVAAEVKAAGADALPLVSDVGDPRSVDGVMAAAIDRFGGIDVLINNAGAAIGADRAPVVELAVEEWNRVLRVNLDGAFLMSRAAAQAMIARGKGGAIVNISSIGSRQAIARSAAYTASKAALNALSRVMAVELAPHDIRVNAVLPGLVKTSRLAELDLSKGDQWDAFVKSYVPLGVAGDGSEIAWMCTFLCSDMGRWITGQDICVDGGSTWH